MSGCVAAGDSEVPYELIRSVARRASGRRATTAMSRATCSTRRRDRLGRRASRFDIIHSHLENHNVPAGALRAGPRRDHAPRDRLDTAGMPELLERFRDVPLVAVSDSQRRWHIDQNWVGTIHHGLPLESMPFKKEHGNYLAFVGRAYTREGRSRTSSSPPRSRCSSKIAAKVHDPHEKPHSQGHPAGDRRRHGGVPGRARPPRARALLYAGARATVMLGGWPEPFGLVAIESMATGTPVIARRAGGLTETVEHGVTGFLVDDVSEATLAFERVPELDRKRIRAYTLERFSPGRMTDQYEEVYRRLLDESATGDADPGTGRAVGPGRPRQPGIRGRRDRTSSPRFRSAPRAPRRARPHARARTQTPRSVRPPAASGQDFDVAVRAVHADPLAVPDEPASRAPRPRRRAGRTHGRSPRRGSSGRRPPSPGRRSPRTAASSSDRCRR